MKIRYLLFFLFLATSAATPTLHGMDYSRETGYKVANFVLKQNMKNRGKNMATFASFWQGKQLSLKKEQLPLVRYQKKINTFKKLHNSYTDLTMQMDPDWSTMQDALLKQRPSNLLWVINVGDFLVCQSDFLDNAAAALRKKIIDNPGQYKHLEKRIKRSAFKVLETRLEKIGTCVLDATPDITNIKFFARYTCSSVNFFAEYDKKILVLPQNNHRKVARICLDDKNDGNFISTNQEGDDTLLLPKPKKPFLWKLGANDAPRTIAVGPFTITASSNSSKVDERSITVKKGATTIATLTCNNPSQVILNEDCFVCVPAIPQEIDDNEARSAIIINFKTGQYYRFSGEWPYGRLDTIAITPTFEAHTYYSNGTVFIQWAKKIDCFELDSEIHKVYDSGCHINGMQISPDGKYLVICDEQPHWSLIKDSLTRNLLGLGDTLRYHIYKFNPKLTKLSHNLKKLMPRPEMGMFAWLGSFWTKKTEWKEPAPENIFTDDAKIESSLSCKEKN